MRFVWLVAATSVLRGAPAAAAPASIGSLDAPAFDPHRANRPQVPFALEPVQWGSVQPQGWLREWAEAARHGAGSPETAPFARIKAHGYPPFTIPPECQLSVDGWKDGRPCSLAFYDEVSLSVPRRFLTNPYERCTWCIVRAAGVQTPCSRLIRELFCHLPLRIFMFTSCPLSSYGGVWVRVWRHPLRHSHV